MRKQILLLLMAVAFCGNAEAQKGRSGVGANLGFVNPGGVIGPYSNMAPCIDLKYNYGLNNMFEIEPWVAFYPTTIIDKHEAYKYEYRSYVSKDSSYIFSGGINLNTYLLKTRIRPFIITGIAMHVVQWPEYTFEVDDYYSQGKLVTGETIVAGGEKGTKIAFRGGIGGDYRISYHSYVQLMALYDTFMGLDVSIGYTYKF